MRTRYSRPLKELIMTHYFESDILSTVICLSEASVSVFMYEKFAFNFTNLHTIFLKFIILLGIPQETPKNKKSLENNFFYSYIYKKYYYNYFEAEGNLGLQKIDFKISHIAFYWN